MFKTSPRIEVLRKTFSFKYVKLQTVSHEERDWENIKVDAKSVFASIQT